jgi:hypothetical protein
MFLFLTVGFFSKYHAINFEFITPVELKNVNEFGTNNWKSLSDLGKSNVESKPIPISRKAL